MREWVLELKGSLGKNTPLVMPQNIKLTLYQQH